MGGLTDGSLMSKIRYMLVLLIVLTGVLLISGCVSRTAEIAIAEMTLPALGGEPETSDPGDSDMDSGAPGKTPLPAATPAPLDLPAVLEERLLVLEWPSRIRTGDSDLIILTLEIDEDGNMTPTAQFDDHQVRGSAVEIPNLYDTHNIIAQARLDLAGVDYTPRGEMVEPMRPGVPVVFSWSISPQNVGTYRGTVWVHLQFIPLDGSEPSRRVLSAQVLELDAVNLLGLGGTPARLIGAVGAMVGAFLSVDRIGGWMFRNIKVIIQAIKPRKSEGQ
jgi:hypothetical protein